MIIDVSILHRLRGTVLLHLKLQATYCSQSAWWMSAVSVVNHDSIHLSIISLLSFCSPSIGGIKRGLPLFPTEWKNRWRVLFSSTHPLHTDFCPNCCRHFSSSSLRLNLWSFQNPFCVPLHPHSILKSVWCHLHIKWEEHRLTMAPNATEKTSLVNGNNEDEENFKKLKAYQP